MKKSELAILSVLILAAVFVFNGKINKVTTGSEEARQQAQFVSSFFDIYENSFR